MPTRRLALLLLAAALAPAARAAGPEPGKAAPDFELAALGGGPVKLSKALESGPVVLVVLRGYPGYQCPACLKQFADFRAKADEFQRRGAQVLFVYPGPSAELKTRAGEFVKGVDYPSHFSVLLDPDYAFTNAYGLRWDAANETAYPAAFLVGPGRVVSYAKVSKTHGGRAAVAEVLKALDSK